MKEQPLVSVIIPCYQTEKYVRHAIDSALAQTYKPIEVLAIDDGSTDTTLAILQEYAGAVTILQHPGGINKGVSLTRKLGIDHATGKYIAFLDADDFFEPEKVATQVATLEKYGDAVLCHTAIRLVCEEGTCINFEAHFNYSSTIDVYDLKKTDNYLLSNRICNSSVLIRADVLLRVPYYGRQMFQFEDWLMWTLAAEHGTFVYLPEQFTCYRYHPESATSSVVNCKIKELYSSIEMYLSIISKPVSETTKYECSYQLLRKIDDLRAEYAQSTGAWSACSGSIRNLLLIASIRYYCNNSLLVRKLLIPLVRLFVR